MNGTACKVNMAFRAFRNARCSFLDRLHELKLEDSAETALLVKEHFVALLMTLIEDPESYVRDHAAIILSRYISCNPEIAKAMVQNECIPLFLEKIQNHPSISFRAYLVDVLREVCGHNSSNVLAVYDQNGIDILLQYICHSNEQLRTSIGWGLAYMARRSRTSAEEIVNQGAVPILLKQVASDRLPVKASATAALCDIIQQSDELTESCVKAYCIVVFAQSFKEITDNNFRWQRFQTLAAIACYRRSWSEMILQAGTVKYAIEALEDNEVRIQCVAATLLMQMMKHEEEMAIWIANQDCVPRCLGFMAKVNSAICKPAVFCIGYIASASSIFSWTILKSKGTIGKSGIHVLESLLLKVKDDEMLQGLFWAMSSIGKHSTNHTEHVVRTQVMKKCIEVHLKPGSSTMLKNQCIAAFESLLKRCEFVPAINVLLPGIQVYYLQFTLVQYCKIIPVDSHTREFFFTSGALEKLQQIQPEPQSTLHKQISIINACYPPDVIKYFNPNFDTIMMSQIDNFFPREQDSLDAALIKYVRRAKLTQDTMDLESDGMLTELSEESKSSKCEDSFYFLFDEEQELFHDDLTVASKVCSDKTESHSTQQ